MTPQQANAKRSYLKSYLTWLSTRHEIEKKLGVPEESGAGRSVVKYWVDCNSKGIYIEYNSLSTTDMNAKMQNLTLFVPK